MQNKTKQTKKKNKAFFLSHLTSYNNMGENIS